MTERTYRACSIRRDRRTRAEIDDIKAGIAAILKADHPMTVRQVFYQLVVRALIEKSEKEYQGTVIRLLTEMRLDGTVPFRWIVDESRRRRITETYDNVTDALEATANFYRRSALREAEHYVEIWCEKEALAGVLWDVVSEYDVPLMISKGMPSLTFLYGSFQEIYRAAETGKQTYIYQLGDHDPSGVLIPRTIETRLNELCDRADCARPIVKRVALTEQQIAKFKLPTRPTKREGNSHANRFEGDSVELDALPPRELRRIVTQVIEQHVSPAATAILRAAEKSEREMLRIWASERTVES